MAMVNLTVRIEAELVDRLDALIERVQKDVKRRTGVSTELARSVVIRDAIATYVVANEAKA